MLYWIKKFFIPMAKNRLINLLPQEEFDASILGRILRWAMGGFRIIVIITEMIVMAAFLSRFWLDAQNSDLGDSIKIASAQISAQSNFEKEFRGVQQKLNIFKQVASLTQPSDSINLVTSTVPPNIVLSSIGIQNTEIQIKGNAGSGTDISQFISNLKAQSTFKNVELDSVGSSDQGQSLLTFLIKINF